MAETIRRSSRAVRPTSVFDATKAASQHKKHSAVTVSDSESSESEASGSQTSESEDDSQYTPVKKRSRVTAPKNKSATANAVLDDVPKSGTRGSGKVQRVVTSGRRGSRVVNADSGDSAVDGPLCQQLSSANDIEPIAVAWVAHYRTDPIAATNKLANLILMAAGAKNESISDDVDLEALDAEEFDGLLADTLRMMATGQKGHYPLVERKKGRSAVTFRSKYQNFFQRVVVLLDAHFGAQRNTGGDVSQTQSVRGTQRRLTKSAETLWRIVDQLSMLTSMALVNIRDAATEAVLSMTVALAELCEQCASQGRTASRQVSAMEKRGGSHASLQRDAKYQAFVKQRDECVAARSSFISIVERAYAAVFIHRSRDFSPVVRKVAAMHAGNLTRAAYLSGAAMDGAKDKSNTNAQIGMQRAKYLGWGAYDPDPEIRLLTVQQIQALVCEESLYDALQPFVEHFIDRFLEMAAGDVSWEVSVATIQLLRSMQTSGFLDSVSEERLDRVDVLVFDPSAHMEVRREALLFVMEHTEGFDDLSDEPNAASGSKKGAAKNHGSRITLQLETLAEFAEHHLDRQSEWAHLLAEACLSSQKAELMLDWSVFLSLLLREQGGPTLTSQKASILLRLLVTSVQVITKERQQLISHSTNGKSLPKSTLAIPGGNVGNSRHQSATARRSAWIHDQYETMQSNLWQKLPALLRFFRVDEEMLRVLSEMLVCLEQGAGTNTGGRSSSASSANPAVLSTLAELFATFRDETLLRNIVSALKMWSEGTSTTGACQVALSKIIDTNDSRLHSSLADMQTVLNNTETLKSRRKSRDASITVELEEHTLSVIGAIRRLRVLWESLDCRSYADASLDSLLEDVFEAMDLLPTVATSGKLSAKVAMDCISGCMDARATCHAILLWQLRDVVQATKALQQKGQGEANEGELQSLDGVDPGLAADLGEKIDAVVATRDNLVDAALTLMQLQDFSLPYEDERISANAMTTAIGLTGLTAEDDVSLFVVVGTPESRKLASRAALELQLDGFRAISAIRAFFPAKQGPIDLLNKLSYRPSEEVLEAQRVVYESGKIHLLDILEVADDPSVVASALVARHCQAFLTNLFFPLAHGYLSSLTIPLPWPRQGATMLTLSLTCMDVPLIAQAVRWFAREVRSRQGTLAFLELSCVALRDTFAREVLPVRQRRAQYEAEMTSKDAANKARGRKRQRLSSDFNSEFDFKEAEETEAAGYEAVDHLARRLSSLLGIAKLRDEPLSALVTFIKACMEYALSNVDNVGFAGCLTAFLRLAPVTVMPELLETYESYMSNNAELRRTARTQELAPTPAWDRLFSLRDHLSGRTRPTTSRVQIVETEQNPTEMTKSKPQGSSRATRQSQASQKTPAWLATAASEDSDAISEFEDFAVPSLSATQNAVRATYGRRPAAAALMSQSDGISSAESSVTPLSANVNSTSRFAMGLNIEDDESEQTSPVDNEFEDVLTSLPQNKRRTRMSSGYSERFSFTGSSAKNKSSDSEFPPFELSTSPIRSTADDIDAIPTTRRRYRS